MLLNNETPILIFKESEQITTIEVVLHEFRLKWQYLIARQ